ncbi:MAG: hypothetical protein HEQ32_05545 [Vampirovibrio sp.]
MQLYQPEFIICPDGVRRRIIDKATFELILQNHLEQISEDNEQKPLDFSFSYVIFELNSYNVSMQSKEWISKTPLILGISPKHHSCKTGFDFTNSIFTENVDLSNTNFTEGISFILCQFNKNLEIKNSIADNLHFIGSKFRGSANFNKTTFIR